MADQEAATWHSFVVSKDGQAQVRVFDNEVMRSAFLYYTNASMRPQDMHRMVSHGEGPQLSSQQFAAMAKDMFLMEPEGPLPAITLGITYASLKADEHEGLPYSAFLDALVDFSFECGRNVADQLQTLQQARMNAAAPRRHRPAALATRPSTSLSRAVSESGALPPQLPTPPPPPPQQPQQQQQQQVQQQQQQRQQEQELKRTTTRRLQFAMSENGVPPPWGGSGGGGGIGGGDGGGSVSSGGGGGSASSGGGWAGNWCSSPTLPEDIPTPPREGGAIHQREGGMRLSLGSAGRSLSGRFARVPTLTQSNPSVERECTLLRRTSGNGEVEPIRSLSRELLRPAPPPGASPSSTLGSSDGRHAAPISTS
ncbi:hypothetical protein FOA52_011978 [Chlamydomonas sp. UWO 241]|nr:hypothetical protein FOA52_011978 [Chlamydomonas sp. UWO 241]